MKLIETLLWHVISLEVLHPSGRMLGLSGLRETKPGYTTTNPKQSEWASKEWRHSTSPKPKKFRIQQSAGKIMLTLFWDELCIILEHYTPRGNTITSESYCNMLKNHLRPAIRSKRRGLLTTGVILQHDNAWSHTAHATVAIINDLHFEMLPHPPYSPDLIPSYYHMFGPPLWSKW